MRALIRVILFIVISFMYGWFKFEMNYPAGWPDFIILILVIFILRLLFPQPKKEFSESNLLDREELDL
jgi:hypothetical protein